MISRLDQLYRRLILTNFFVKGWGDPGHIEQILHFRKLIARRETCQQLLGSPNVTVEQEQPGDGFSFQHGYFSSPLVDVLGDIMPKATQTAHFKIILPKKWRSPMRPMCLHLAGTGDHGYSRRERFMAKPLAINHGIGSILLENPFYGCRKPADQFRSSLHYVSDLFVMGGALILESMALLDWCRKQGHGPLGLTGISMGGHMACLAGSNVPFPISLIPCMSWTTSSSVFTQGVLKDSVPWKLLTKQFRTNSVFSETLQPLTFSPEFDTPSVELMDTASIDKQCEMGDKITSAEYMELKRRLETLPVCDHPSTSEQQPTIKTENKLSAACCGCPSTQRFFKQLLDETTHLGNFSVPFDPTLATLVMARYDSYVPRSGVMDLHALWPGSSLRFLEYGHVASAIKSDTRGVFQQAIVNSLDMQQQKYYS